MDVRSFAEDPRVQQGLWDAHGPSNQPMMFVPNRSGFRCIKAIQASKEKSTPSFVESLGINCKSCRPIRVIWVIQHSDGEIPGNRKELTEPLPFKHAAKYLQSPRPRNATD